VIWHVVLVGLGTASSQPSGVGLYVDRATRGTNPPNLTYLLFSFDALFCYFFKYWSRFTNRFNRTNL